MREFKLKLIPASQDALVKYGFRIGVALLCAVRLSFGFLHLLQAWALKLGLPSGVQPGSALYTIMSELSLAQLLAWTLYALGYIATAILALAGHRRVVWVAAATALLDALYWISLSLIPQYQAGYSVNYSLGDAMINTTTVLICLGSVMVSRESHERRRTG